MGKKIKGRVGGIKIDSIVYTPEKKLLAVPLAEQGCMASPTTTKKTTSIFMVKIFDRGCLYLIGSFYHRISSCYKGVFLSLFRVPFYSSPPLKFRSDSLNISKTLSTV